MYTSTQIFHDDDLSSRAVVVKGRRLSCRAVSSVYGGAVKAKIARRPNTRRQESAPPPGATLSLGGATSVEFARPREPRLADFEPQNNNTRTVRGRWRHYLASSAPSLARRGEERVERERRGAGGRLAPRLDADRE